MARPLASDHDDKRAAILKAAARLFAGQGYDHTSITEIATACAVSKALIYHYYDSKDHLLFDMIRAHLDDLVKAVDGVMEREPRLRLKALIAALLAAYRHADDEHQIQISEMKRLPDAKKAELVALERHLVRVFSEAIGAMVPALGADPQRLKPVTMNIFGMMNWKFMWFRENGPITHEAFADLVMAMAEAGAKEAGVKEAGAMSTAPQKGPRIVQM